MELHDGFIVGIYNYCDRWCEACAFTSRCRTFAACAEGEARLDPSLKALIDAPPLRQAPGIRPQAPVESPGWIQELFEAINRALGSPDALRFAPNPPPPDHVAIEERAHGYAMRVHDWRGAREAEGSRDPTDPRAIIAWFAYYIAPKVHRAVRGLADEGPGDRGSPADHDGSAKAALIAIERSHAAWRALVAAGGAHEVAAQPFLADLEWLEHAVERAFPRARLFVRPGLDEPDAVARLAGD